jgi:hypothetical protein
VIFSCRTSGGLERSQSQFLSQRKGTMKGSVLSFGWTRSMKILPHQDQAHSLNTRNLHNTSLPFPSSPMAHPTAAITPQASHTHLQRIHIPAMEPHTTTLQGCLNPQQGTLSLAKHRTSLHLNYLPVVRYGTLTHPPARFCTPTHRISLPHRPRRPNLLNLPRSPSSPFRPPHNPVHPQ